MITFGRKKRYNVAETGGGRNADSNSYTAESRRWCTALTSSSCILQSNLSYASLRNADLTGADLTGSIHGNADFSGANMNFTKNY